MSELESKSKFFDIAIIGGGILGVTTAFWLSKLYECSIALVDKEHEVARHTSARNTGVVHRPFYLNSRTKRVFASAANTSYFMWRDLAQRYNLAWNQVGTLEVAMHQDSIQILRDYQTFAVDNGMNEDEIEFLDSNDVRRIEPEVSCLAAFHSKTDTAVNFGELTNKVFEFTQRNGVTFIGGFEAQEFRESPKEEMQIQSKRSGASQFNSLSCRLLINLAGGSAVNFAHDLHLAIQYTDLHFRGEYWKVSEQFGLKIGKNVYSVPAIKEFPFLDPHFIVKANGTREVGPNAVLVFGPYAYKGLSEKKEEIISKIFERPNSPKLKLFTNGTFLKLVIYEWKSSFSKKAMCDRVSRFIPSLESRFLVSRGVSGVRSSLIDNKGFVPEAVLLYGKRSFHVLNYNSPGATGAPAFSAHIVSNLREKGYLDGFAVRRDSQDSDNVPWNFEDATSEF